MTSLIRHVRDLGFPLEVVRAVEALRPRVEGIAAGLLDELEARAAADPDVVVDLVEDYCARLPVIVIAEILGVPPEQHAKVLRMGSAAAPSLDMGLPWSEFTAVEDALAGVEAGQTAVVAEVRRAGAVGLLLPVDVDEIWVTYGDVGVRVG